MGYPLPDDRFREDFSLYLAERENRRNGDIRAPFALS
jgi:hypothetical protein